MGRSPIREGAAVTAYPVATTSGWEFVTGLEYDQVSLVSRGLRPHRLRNLTIAKLLVESFDPP